jgi:hypothetical protein
LARSPRGAPGQRQHDKRHGKSSAISAQQHRSFDDLVGAGEQSGRDRHAKGRGGLEIDDELELRRLLNWEI